MHIQLTGTMLIREGLSSALAMLGTLQSGLPFQDWRFLSHRDNEVE